MVGVAAYSVEQTNGVQTRKAVQYYSNFDELKRQYNSNLDELKRAVVKEKDCLSFLGITESKFDYCKVGTKGYDGVVAVIGDSHAHIAFPGISEGLEEFGLTTVLLANSSCPPLIDSHWG